MPTVASSRVVWGLVGPDALWPIGAAKRPRQLREPVRAARALNGDLSSLVKRRGAKDSVCADAAEQMDSPLADVPLGAIGEPTRSPSPFQTTRDHRTPTP